MPLPIKMGFDLTLAELTTIDTAIASIATVMNSNAQINLTTDERKSARSVAEGRKPYMDKTYETLAPNNPPLLPGYLNFPEDNTNFNYSKQLRSRLMVLYKVVEIIEDHSFSAENLSYRWMLKFYNNAKEARDTNTPGADSVVAELAPLFEQSNTAAPAPPTPTVTTEGGS